MYKVHLIIGIAKFQVRQPMQIFKQDSLLPPALRGDLFLSGAANFLSVYCKLQLQEK